jgi:hypothetical protein
MMFRAVFWVVLPCKMIVDRRFRGAYCIPDDGGSTTQKTALNIKRTFAFANIFYSFFLSNASFVGSSGFARLIQFHAIFLIHVCMKGGMSAFLSI